MKDILTTGLGMFIFGDVKFEPKNVIGVAVGLTGGILYAYFSYRDSQQKAAVNPFTSLLHAGHRSVTAQREGPLNTTCDSHLIHRTRASM